MTGVADETRTIDDLQTGGTVRPIVRWGTPVMHNPTRPTTEFDGDLATLIRDMFATMHAAEGVGLAATQVGVDQSVFVFDCPDDDHVRHVGVVCNPEVILPEGKDRKLDVLTRAACRCPVATSNSPGPIGRPAGARTRTATRSRSSAPVCWPAACNTRPTT